MTIASEISRLQCAKADIKASIENKGVTVGSSDTIDCYSACIDAIQSGNSTQVIDLLVVGGGGNGVSNGGGGAGGVIYRERQVLENELCTVKVGAGACNSEFGNCIAYSGGNSCTGTISGCGGSGAGGYATDCSGKYRGGYACPFQGNPGDFNCCDSGKRFAGGGGGAGGQGNIKGYGYGGDGVQFDISGECCYYAGGGAGRVYCTSSACYVDSTKGGCGGGGNSARNDCNATYYGGGGGGGGGCGYQGIVILRYKTDGSDGINPDCACGGCKYCCGDYTIHCFDTVGDYFFYTKGCLIKEPGVYHNPSQCLLTLSSDGVNWYSLMDRNLGATTNDISNTGSYGCYYQWGNNYGMSCSPSKTSTRVDASNYGPGNYYSRNCFICTSNNLDWSTVQNDNLRGDTTNTLEARRGPAPEGYHIPNVNSRNCVLCNLKCLKGSDLTQADVEQYLFFARTGYLGYNSGTRSCGGTCGSWWMSDFHSGSDASYINGHTISSGNPNPNFTSGNYNRRGTGYVIRPFKNVGVQPTVDGGWGKIL